MTDVTEQKQTIYSSSDMAVMLIIQESTLRKYCLMLEEAGYKFHKNELGHRGFFHNDVIALKRLIEIKKHPDMTLKQACNAVIAWINENDVTDSDITDVTQNEQHSNRYNELSKQFEEFKKQQNEFNKELIDQLKKQQNYIENVLVERDKKLIEALRETQETKKLIAATAESEEQRAKKSWWQFWK
ncbi:DUF3967 domain-containing protein [Metabacillus fastidiosus]|uniref:DUF3967 domain-containing protein n=1 Tax=Metabacillus fastidiosus TaxID=1458 RepID=UPI002E212BA6|nr:DUF3967 domain-containing protein [Metabacillus fastidiosus]